MFAQIDAPSGLTIPEMADAAPGTTQEQVYRRLRNAVMVGAIAPGTALTMRGLATALGVSATPIREAMRRLSSEMAVLELGNRRFQIAEMELGRFEDLIATRLVLETHAAARALPYASEVAIDDLAELDILMDQALAVQDYDGLTRLNHDFHRGLYRLNPHQTTLPLIESIWLQLGPFQRQVIRDLHAFYVVDRHKQIVSALRQRDETALREAIAQDIHDGIGRAGRAALQASPG